MQDQNEVGLIAVAMSGGVDSSVAAALLLRGGRSVVGVTMTVCDSPAGRNAVESAGAMAQRLGIQHHVVDLRADFEATVVRDFVDSYVLGVTPNPCVLCNPRIKFGLLLERSLALGATHMATGHYVKKVRYARTGRYTLARGMDRKKDQTYVLYRLSQDQLALSIFPLGGYTKEEVRRVARDLGLGVAERPESQEACFTPSGDYRAFIAARAKDATSPGTIVDLDGNVVGTHAGTAMYTIGQRKGLGSIGARRAYVVDIIPESHVVVVGPEQALYSRTLHAGNLNFLPFPTLESSIRVSARIRYKSPAAPAQVSPEGPDMVRVVFDQPQRAITPGQSVVF
jgi:tRNA-specific 2-thiouridylase